MNTEARKILERIVKKDIPSLTIGDIIFIKARRSYLTPEQTEKFRHLWEEIKIPVKEDRPSYKELREKAKSLGIKLKFGMKREAIEELINNYQPNP